MQAHLVEGAGGRVGAARGAQQQRAVGGLATGVEHGAGVQAQFACAAHQLDAPASAAIVAGARLQAGSHLRVGLPQAELAAGGKPDCRAVRTLGQQTAQQRDVAGVGRDRYLRGAQGIASAEQQITAAGTQVKGRAEVVTSGRNGCRRQCLGQLRQLRQLPGVEQQRCAAPAVGLAQQRAAQADAALGRAQGDAAALGAGTGADIHQRGRLLALGSGHQQMAGSGLGPQAAAVSLAHQRIEAACHASQAGARPGGQRHIALAGLQGQAARGQVDGAGLADGSGLECQPGADAGVL